MSLKKIILLNFFATISIFVLAQSKTVGDIPLPYGFHRVPVQNGSFAEFLRNMPLSDDNTVYYYNGEKKYDQSAHYAVIDYDIGNRDLQQCADAVMRLRAEYLFAQKRYSEIHFNFLGDGKPHYYLDYAGNDRSYKKFRKYLNYVFAYANTASLKKELLPVDIDKMQIGDVFIQSGNPYGHAMIVVDMAINIRTHQKIFLLAQSFMPAQSIHIVINPLDANLSPWYSTDFVQLQTPYWTFTRNDLRRFQGE